MLTSLLTWPGSKQSDAQCVRGMVLSADSECMLLFCLVCS
jgi:hypothetical protein